MLKYFEIVTNIKVTNISNLIKKIHFMISRFKSIK